MPLSSTTAPAAPLVHLSSDFIRAKEYLEAIVTSTSDAICTTDVGGRILYFSPGAEAMIGASGSKMIGRSAHELYVGGRAEADRMMRLLRKQGSLHNHETVLKRADGGQIHVSMSVSLMRDRRGKIIGTLGISKDITRRVELERRLLELSITDNLTGLYNQRHFRDRLGQEILRARRLRGRLSMVLIDLDGFKRINDDRGHLEGDRMLREFSDVLRQCIRREVDSAYRYGGDEFIVLLPGQSQKGALAVARRVTAAAHAALGRQGLRFSYGVAGYPPSASVEDFIRLADERMYKMKASNKRAASSSR